MFFLIIMLLQRAVHEGLLQCLNRLSDGVTADTFHTFCTRHPYILYPITVMQTNLRSSAIGVELWREQTYHRFEVSDEAYIPFQRLFRELRSGKRDCSKKVLASERVMRQLSVQGKEKEGGGQYRSSSSVGGTEASPAKSRHCHHVDAKRAVSFEKGADGRSGVRKRGSQKVEGHLKSHFTLLPLTSLHFLSLHFTSLHFTSLPLTSLYYLTFHFLSLHFTSSHFTTSHFTSLTSLHFTSLPLTFLYFFFTSSHFTSSHFTSSHFTSLRLTSLHFLSLHFTSSHFTASHFVSHFH
jgi:hypothetical protein